MQIIDGHVHSNYCPHGTKESMDSYIKKAIQLGYKQITFTEHAPLPFGFEDPAPTKDSAMQQKDFHNYIQEIDTLKHLYKEELIIRAGLEVDYIEGWERQTTLSLTQWGPEIDEMILSVHFIKKAGEWFCLDYSDKEFQRMIPIFGSVDAIYQTYYQTLKKAIESDLGPFKPKRIGHLSLISKFQKKYPPKETYTNTLLSILDMIKERGYEIDLNTAGLFKPLCKETYPPMSILEKAKEMGIPLIYGTDAHHPSQLGRGLEMVKRLL